MRYGSVPAGGLGTRLGHRGFSKELQPVGQRAAIEHLLERMVTAGIEKIFINTAADKMDLVTYLSVHSPFKSNCVFLVRERRGLFDGITQPAAFLKPDDELYFGLPDTLWFPKTGFEPLVAHPAALVLGLFDSGTPHKFDSVVTDANNRIESVHVKVDNPPSRWTWGIGKILVSEVDVLRACEAEAAAPTFGATVHRYAQHHAAYALPLGDSRYLDIGTGEDLARAEHFLLSLR